MSLRGPTGGYSLKQKSKKRESSVQRYTLNTGAAIHRKAGVEIGFGSLCEDNHDKIHGFDEDVGKRCIFRQTLMQNSWH